MAVSSAPQPANRQPSGVDQPAPCALCGLPSRAPILAERPEGGSLIFCCNGCRNVWRILSESGQLGESVDVRSLPLFLQAQSLGLLGAGAEGDRGAETGIAEATPPDERGSVADLRQCILRIDGMWCASCAWLIGETLRRRKGVVSANVSFATDSARVTYRPARLGVEDLRESVASLGYRAEEGDSGAASGMSDERRARQRRELVRAGIAFIFAMNVMMLTPVLYSGQFQGITPLMSRFVSWLLFALSLPVFVCGWPLFDRALRAARRGAATMETLVAVGSTTALLYSVYQLIHGTARSYFDTADMLIGLVLVGKYVESSIRSSAVDAITLLHGLAPKKATLVREGGSEAPVAVAQLGVGDLIRVRAGEAIAADGTVERGSGSVDESLLTGEARPVPKQPGDDVTGGSTLGDGALDIRVGRAVGDGALQQMASLVQESLHRKTRSEQSADRISRVFVPVVMALALATGLWVWGASHHDIAAAMTRAVAVLVIACPCALGIATPMAIMAGVAAAAHHGILIADPEALETATRLKRVIFDKTGTLTEGRFKVREVLPEGADLGAVAAAEQMSEHPIAQAIRAYAAGPPAPINVGTENGDFADTDFQRVDGCGVIARVGGLRVFVGNARLAESMGAAIPGRYAGAAREWSVRGLTVVFFGAEGDTHVSGAIGLGDSLRPGAASLIDSLRRSAVESEIVSGDSSATVASLAAAAGIESWRGGVLPAQKAELVAERMADLAGQGAVGMVGDGVNDAPALARADLGIAMASGADIAGKAAGVTLLSGRIERVSELIAVSQATSKVMRQNLFWALGYNLVCVPLAIAGGITPIWAAAAMLVSSLTVLANTRRLAWSLGRMRQP